MLITSISGAAIPQIRQSSPSDRPSCSRPGGPKDFGDQGSVDAREIARFFQDTPKILGQSHDLLSTAGSSVDADGALRNFVQGSDQMANKMKPWTTPDLRRSPNIIGVIFAYAMVLSHPCWSFPLQSMAVTISSNLLSDKTSFPV
jgi:hypothetical protein